MMDAPDDPQGKTPDPVAYRQYLSETQPDKVAAYDEYLKATGQNAGPDQYVQSLHQQQKLGTLAPRIASENAMDAEPSGATRALGTLSAGMGAIPGGQALQSGVSSLVNRIPYDQARSQIREAESSAPAYTRIPAQLAGGLSTMGVLPASGLKAGAILGGANELLKSDPNAGIGNRLATGTLGAGAGALIGKGTDMAIGAGRALLSKGGEAAKDAALTARSDAASPLYDAVRNAPTKPLTPEMSAMLQHPDVAPIVDRLGSLEQFKGVEPNDPRFLDAVRKSLSDWGHTLDKSGNVLDPSKPNNIAALKEHIGLLKNAFDQAADTQVPGFSNAVKTFADESVPVSGQEAGYDAMKRSLGGNLTSWKNIGKKTPDALNTFLDRNPAGAEGATQGVLAAAKDASKLTGNPLKGFGIPNALSIGGKAAPLLRATDAASGNQLPSALQRALLAAAQGEATP